VRTLYIRSSALALFAALLISLAACATRSVCGECANGEVCDTSTRTCQAAPPDETTGGAGDTDGGDGDLPDDECEPGGVVCADSTVTRCDDSGEVADETECLLDCADDEQRCRAMVPSNGAGEFLEAAENQEPISLTGDVVFDTDSGSLLDSNGDPVAVVSFPVEAPEDGVPLRVFVARGFQLDSATVHGASALVLVATEGIDISGSLVVRSGAMPTQADCAGKPGTSVFNDETLRSGRGGAGSRDRGADGGDVLRATDIPGGLGGLAFDNPDLVPLRGGCPGGVPGGAVQLVSETEIVLGDGAVIDANADSSGASGGGVLLEAPRVALGEDAGIFANGSGGGGGPECGSGEGGRLDRTPASGAQCTRSTFGDGGAGGTGAVSPLPGEPASANGSSDTYGGGGGGSAGYIRINTRNGSFESALSTVFSPEPTTGPLLAE